MRQIRMDKAMKILQAATITPRQMGEDIAKILPGGDPVLHRPDISVEEQMRNGHGSRRIIPVCQPTLNGNEKKYVNECLDGNWISSAGRFITAFERAFADACGTKYGIACTSGTSALHLAMATMDLGPGDEVILPTFTMIATVNAVAYMGATPVLVDSEPETWNIDMNQVADKITAKTRVVVPVHTYGHPADMNPLMTLAEKHGFSVLEDAAEAHGATYEGRKVGNLGHAAAFSFYANKNITTGEGGMLTTNNDEFAKVSRTLRDHAFSPELHFWHKFRGFNYRMTNMQAAIGLAQVEQLDELVARRRENAALYNLLLGGIPGVTRPPEASNVQGVFWMYSIMVDQEFGMTRDQLRGFLAEKGVETRTFFIPVHFQPIYFEAFKGQRFAVAEGLCKDGLYLPSSASLTEDDIHYVTDMVKLAHHSVESASLVPR
jgi:perosamine synthetase